MDRHATSAFGGAKRTSPGSQKLYALSSLVIQTFKEVADEQRDLVSRFVECEMSRIQDVDFCSRHIVGMGCRPGDGSSSASSGAWLITVVTGAAMPPALAAIFCVGWAKQREAARISKKAIEMTSI